MTKKVSKNCKKVMHESKNCPVPSNINELGLEFLGSGHSNGSANVLRTMLKQKKLNFLLFRTYQTN